MSHDTLAQVLAALRAEGAPEVTERLPGDTVRCLSCAHRCVIKPGRDGICRVRSNVDGKLMVPRGYVAGVQVDPIEKKPFFHVLPGNDALSFGMLGCDLHCAYCFPGEVRVSTTEGTRRIGDLFDEAPAGPTEEERAPAIPTFIIADDGSPRPVRRLFRHYFAGDLVSVKTGSGEGFEATPDHPVLATRNLEKENPRFVAANELEAGTFLTRPVRVGRGENVVSERPRTLTRSSRLGSASTVLENSPKRCEDYRYFPVRSVSRRPYQGWVYNLEAEGRHTYLANGFAVHNCQNWVTSQALRDPVAGAGPKDIDPEELTALALREHAPVVVSTYNEPLITSEWAMEVMTPAKEAGLLCGFVSNGNATEEVLDFIRPLVSLYKIDLKSFDDKHYRSLGAPLEHILEGIRLVHGKGFWLEIVTLVIPGFNDDEGELRDMARFLRAISPDIPWHVTGFHDDYKMGDQGDTPASKLIRAAEIGTEEGLHFVYAGNRPGRVGEWENTRCPSCSKTLIRRQSFRILECSIGHDGACPGCGTKLPGVWDHPLAQRRSKDAPALPRRVR